MYILTNTRVKIIFVIVFLINLTSALTNEVKQQTNNASSNSTEEHKPKESQATEIEARKKQEEGMMNRVLPMMIIPFMISTGLIPMMLVSLKVMLMKSAFIGKLAVILLLLNMFRSRSSGQGGVYTHNVPLQDMHMAHYGYSGDEEYGAYVNGKKRHFR